MGICLKVNVIVQLESELALTITLRGHPLVIKALSEFLSYFIHSLFLNVTFTAQEIMVYSSPVIIYCSF